MNSSTTKKKSAKEIKAEEEATYIEYKNKCKENIRILMSKHSREKFGIKCNRPYFSKKGIGYVVDERRDITNTELATLCSVSGPAIKTWLDKDNIVPGPRPLLCLSEAFGVSVDWIIGNHDTISSKIESDYDVLGKYGFTADAFQTLAKLQEQGEDMTKVMAGINSLLSYKEEHPKIIPYKSKKTYYDYNEDKVKHEVTINSDEPASYDETVLYTPALDTFNTYFNINRTLSKVNINNDVFKEILKRIKQVEKHKQLFGEKSPDLIDEYSAIISILEAQWHQANPEDAEAASITKVSTSLQECKAFLVNQKFNCLSKAMQKALKTGLLPDDFTDEDYEEFESLRDFKTLYNFYNKNKE